MRIHYKVATVEEIEIIVSHRILFAIELSGPRPEKETEFLRNNLQAYFAKATAEGTCISVFAEAEGVVAGIGSVHLRTTAGNFKNPSGRWGYIMNMFTVPAFRKKGICKGILDALIEEGLKGGVTAFELHATPEGEKVYIKNEFILHDEPTYRKFGHRYKLLFA